MISRLDGILESMASGAATIRLPAGICLEVLLPDFAVSRLGGAIGQPVTLHTLFYLEQQSQGTTITPRLAGFLTERDRRFFQLFITVKGVGHRKALRAMAMPVDRMAAAIADRDASTLQSLPEIGKRSAETIVVTLKEKVDPFLEAPTPRAGAAAASTTGEAAPGEAEAGEAGPTGELARDSLHVLMQLGENRVDALQLIDRVLGGEDPPKTSAEVVAAVYQMRR
ncbi:MAG: Holliday junction branch migration protein RuvA [Phycisphaeraceae bacterium]